MTCRKCVVIAAAIGTFLACLVAGALHADTGPRKMALPAHPADQSDPAIRLQRVLDEYEAHAPLKQAAPEPTRRAWVEQLARALSLAPGGGTVRLRLLNELGALQASLGDREAARATCEIMAQESRVLKASESLVVALGNQFELLPSKDFVQKDRVAREWDVALASWVSEKKLALGKHGLDDYANAMLQIGSMYKQWAAELKESGHPARGEVAAKQAITYFERSMTFGDINNWPKSARLQAIAELQSFLGKSKEAAETFGKIAELPESGVCWLDMKHRQLQVLHAPNSREYRRAVEELLSEFTRQGRKDRYEITLRRSLAEDYQRAGDFKKSNEHLGRIVGEENDPSLDAMTLLLMAENYRGLGVTDLYSTTLKKLVEKYPNTGAGQAAALRIRPGGSP